jgi:hypothetical protein
VQLLNAPKYNMEIPQTTKISTAERELGNLNNNIQIIVHHNKGQSDGSSYFSGNTTTIYLTKGLSNNILEITYIHELLHEILRYEGYPVILPVIDKRDPDFPIVKTIAALLTSAVQHPEIYNRMKSKYNLDTKRYFIRMLSIKRKSLPHPILTGISGVFYSQILMIFLQECFYYDDPYKKDGLYLLENYDSAAFNRLEVFNSNNSTNFYNNCFCISSARALFSEIKNYNNHLPNPMAGLWNKMAMFEFSSGLPIQL